MTIYELKQRLFSLDFLQVVLTKLKFETKIGSPIIKVVLK